MGAICAWAAIVALFFLWQAVSYRGVVAFFAEWQFNLFGQYFPTLSYLLFVLVFAFPVLLLVRGRWWEADADDSPGQAVERTLAGVTRFMRAMLLIAVGFAVTALIALLTILLLPSSSGPVQTVRADYGAPLPEREGATVLDGSIVYSRTAALDQDVWLTRHGLRFAPVVGVGKQDRSIRYFVELRDEERLRPDSEASRRRGILKRNALPGELVRLYSYAGFDVADPYYVLFTDEASLRWPHLNVAVQLLVAGLFFALLGGWQALVRRRLVRRRDELRQA